MEDIIIDFDELDDMFEKIGFSQYGIPQIKDAAAEVFDVLKKLRLILLMASLYPALIDAVLHGYGQL
jgi:hypothetical protein